jgi:hypothetical protein
VRPFATFAVRADDLCARHYIRLGYYK